MEEKLIEAVRKAFMSVINTIVDDTIIADLIRAIEQNNLEAAYNAIGIQEAVWDELSDALQAAYKAAGIAFSATFPAILNGADGRFVFHFGMRNPFVEKWLREQSSRLITSISQDVRDNIRTIASEGQALGVNPRTTALNIVGRVDPITKKRTGGIIGLTVGQERWVKAAERRLRSPFAEERLQYLEMSLRDKRFDRVVQSAVKNGKPLTEDQIQNLLTRYRDKALRYRGEVIARTEVLQGQSAAEHEATRQVVALGAVEQSAVRREWDSAGDFRVRPSHRQMDGQVVGFDEPFVTPTGARLMYPGDRSLGAPASEIIQCRCRAKPKIDWIR
jgi:hypothetical protein